MARISLACYAKLPEEASSERKNKQRDERKQRKWKLCHENIPPTPEKNNENGLCKENAAIFFSSYRSSAGTRMKVRGNVCPEESPLYTCESFSR